VIKVDVKELESKFKDMSGQIDTMRKDFELKLDSATKDATQYKELAFKREEELRQVKEKAERDKFEQEQRSKEARKNDIKTFSEALVKDGKLTPAQKEIVVPLMESMTSDSEIHKFIEKDGSVKSHTQLSLLKAFLGTLKKSVSYGEFSPSGTAKIYTPDNAVDDDSKQTFMDVKKEGSVIRMAVDEADLAAKAYQHIEEQAKAGRRIDYYQALVELSPKQKVSA
jgi:hypothetical protein